MGFNKDLLRKKKNEINSMQIAKKSLNQVLINIQNKEISIHENKLFFLEKNVLRHQQLSCWVQVAGRSYVCGSMNKL